jgi:hypothetical protein
MKRQLIILMLTTFLLTTTIVPAVLADAALTNERFRATGNYNIVAAGVGLEGTTDGTITLDIPTTGNSEIIAAYLYWSGYNPDTGGDTTVDFESSTVIVIDTFGADLWYGDNYCYVHVADVKADIQIGLNTYTIEGVNFARNFGAGIIVIYQTDLLPLAEVIILDGLDNFWFGWPNPRGPNSEVTSFTFDDMDTTRIAEMVLFAGATEHDDRPNKIWTETGPGTPPAPTADLITSPSTADGNYPLIGSDGHSWDTYIDDVTIAANDEWAAVQVESIDTGEAGAEYPHDGRGSSGVLIAGGFVLPIPEDFEGLTPGFWKNHPCCWEDYVPEDKFNDVFGVAVTINAQGKKTGNSDPTLMEALNAKGGVNADKDEYGALVRHAVAALLNADRPEVNYPMSESEIIDAVADAINGITDAAEVKDMLDMFNNAGGGIDAHCEPL